MPLADEQRLLTRLLTDPALAAAFRSDPERVAREAGVLPDAVGSLLLIPQGQLQTAASSLVRKRASAVAALLPQTARALGPATFHELFRGHAASFVPSGPKRHRDDALAFAASLGRGRPDLPAWASDLAALEAAGLRLLATRRRLIWLWLGHDPTDLTRAIHDGSAPPARATWLLAARLTAASPPRWLKLRWPWGKRV